MGGFKIGEHKNVDTENLVKKVEAHNSFINAAGDTMQGTLNMNQNKLTNLATPVEPLDAVTKQFVEESTRDMFKIEKDKDVNFENMCFDNFRFKRGTIIADNENVIADNTIVTKGYVDMALGVNHRLPFKTEVHLNSKSSLVDIGPIPLPEPATRDQIHVNATAWRPCIQVEAPISCTLFDVTLNRINDEVMEIRLIFNVNSTSQLDLLRITGIIEIFRNTLSYPSIPVPPGTSRSDNGADVDSSMQCAIASTLNTEASDQPSTSRRNAISDRVEAESRSRRI